MVQATGQVLFPSPSSSQSLGAVAVLLPRAALETWVRGSSSLPPLRSRRAHGGGWWVPPESTSPGHTAGQG